MARRWREGFPGVQARAGKSSERGRFSNRFEILSEMAAQTKTVEGLLTCTSSGRRGMHGFHRPLPSFEQLGSYQTVTRFPYGSFHPGTPQPKISPHGSRALHASQVLSESTKVVSNRPLSPHLPLKKPQLSATYSISHRIFGGSVASLILIVPVAMKFSLMYDV